MDEHHFIQRLDRRTEKLEESARGCELWRAEHDGRINQLWESQKATNSAQIKWNGLMETRQDSLRLSRAKLLGAMLAISVVMSVASAYLSKLLG